jgi:hypothetical protein
MQYTLGYCPGICLQELKESTGTSVRIADVPAETRTEHLSETNLQLSRYASPLGDPV